tara:strand:+ start:35 stop:151 length:117 start_codon:yes stop_codon:yes gene_type:complete
VEVVEVLTDQLVEELEVIDHQFLVNHLVEVALLNLYHQ